MIAREATDADVDYVARHLREHSAREALTRGDAEHLVRELAELKPMALVRAALVPPEWPPPRAAAIFVVYRHEPGHVLFQTLSTDQWPAIARPFIRWFNRRVAPSLAAGGITRASFDVLDDPPAILRWFDLMNIRPVGPAREGSEPRMLPMEWRAPTVDAAAPGIGSPS